MTPPHDVIKLKIAMSKIQDILDTYDIAGVILLHTPGTGEYRVALAPSYSCVTIDEEKGTLHIKDQIEGTKEDAIKKLMNTCNMLSIISDMGIQVISDLSNASMTIDKQLNVEHIKREDGSKN